MSSGFQNLEKQFFRRLNAVVEPAVRHGLGSPRLTPASLIVLETTGFKSGKQRRTPLWSIRLGRYRLVSTFRGDRSFWLKNLQKKPRASYYLAGKRRASEAVVVSPDASSSDFSSLPPLLRRLAERLQSYVGRGWAFAILSPVK